LRSGFAFGVNNILHHTMAQPNENKSQTENKRHYEEMKLFQAEILERMERLENGNESKFDKIYTTLDLLITQFPEKQDPWCRTQQQTIVSGEKY
jgi:hypothetical protein